MMKCVACVCYPDNKRERKLLNREPLKYNLVNGVFHLVDKVVDAIEYFFFSFFLLSTYWFLLD